MPASKTPAKANTPVKVVSRDQEPDEPEEIDEPVTASVAEPVAAPSGDPLAACRASIAAYESAFVTWTNARDNWASNQSPRASVNIAALRARYEEDHPRPTPAEFVH